MHGGQTMARYQISDDGSVTSTEITEISDQRQLLGAFGDCQTGQSSCPTDEYEKLALLGLRSPTTAFGFVWSPRSTNISALPKSMHVSATRRACPKKAARSNTLR